MKKILILSILFASAAFAAAQENVINDRFADFTTDDRFTQVSISGKMFELMSSIEPENSEERAMLEAISNLSGMKMLVCGNCAEAASEYSTAVSKMNGSTYEVLLEARENGQKQTFYVREQGTKVAELVLIGYVPDEFFILSLTGDIDLDQIANIGRAMEIDGLDRLEKMEER